MSDSGTLLPWLPALLIVALCAWHSRLPGCRLRKPAQGESRLLAAIAVLGSAALAVSVWQGSAASNEIARLQQNDRTEQLALQVKSLEQELTKLKEATRARSLGEQTATKLADYLRPYGSRKIVVSCVPNDVEAYRYATETRQHLEGRRLGCQRAGDDSDLRQYSGNGHQRLRPRFGGTGYREDPGGCVREVRHSLSEPRTTGRVGRRRQGRTIRRRKACAARRRDN